MNRLAHTLLCAALTAAAAPACDRSANPASTSTAGLAELSVDQLAALLASAAPPVVFDANSDETRSEFGLIPGAKPLPNRKFEPEAVLPEAKDTKLVFYCGSTRCQSAEGAASKALAAGYQDVAVLPAGIRGWKKAGKETQPYRASGT